jgi:hypothetical protein
MSFRLSVLRFSTVANSPFSRSFAGRFQSFLYGVTVCQCDASALRLGGIRRVPRGDRPLEGLGFAQERRSSAAAADAGGTDESTCPSFILAPVSAPPR